MDVFGGEIRRRDVFPLLVLHLIAREPAYGNRLIEEIERITEGVISVNPNTIYPLLRELEARGMIEGDWEHPDRRTRRYYSITAAGRREHKRLRAELEPFLDSVIRSVTPDQARDLRGERLRRVESLVEALAGRGLGPLLRARRLAGLGRRLRRGRVARGLSRRRAARSSGARPGRARDGQRAGARARAAPPAPDRVHRPRVQRRAGERASRSRARRARVTLALDYRLARGGPLRGVTERVFVRAQVRGSLERTLLRFAHEAEAVASRLGRRPTAPTARRSADGGLGSSDVELGAEAWTQRAARAASTGE